MYFRLPLVGRLFFKLIAVVLFILIVVVDIASLGVLFVLSFISVFSKWIFKLGIFVLFVQYFILEYLDTKALLMMAVGVAAFGIISISPQIFQTIQHGLVMLTSRLFDAVTLPLSMSKQNE